jgi:hypothetical protein
MKRELQKNRTAEKAKTTQNRTSKKAEPRKTEEGGGTGAPR